MTNSRACWGWTVLFCSFGAVLADGVVLGLLLVSICFVCFGFGFGLDCRCIVIIGVTIISSCGNC